MGRRGTAEWLAEGVRHSRNGIMIRPGRYFRLRARGKWVENSVVEALASCCGVNLAEFTIGGRSVVDQMGAGDDRMTCGRDAAFPKWHHDSAGTVLSAAADWQMG